MQSSAENPQAYLDSLPEDRQQSLSLLRKAILKNLPKGFSEVMSYGMIGYVVPHSLYPAGYHCNPKLPLPFLAIASQKNFAAVYHMGIYADPKLMEWFTGGVRQAEESHAWDALPGHGQELHPLQEAGPDPLRSDRGTGGQDHGQAMDSPV